jgi:hypothetical protein
MSAIMMIHYCFQLLFFNPGQKKTDFSASLREVVAPGGIEPPTQGFSVLPVANNIER